MEEQFVGVRHIFYIKQFHMRVSLRVEILIHILEHIFNTILLAVADAPYRVEGQTFHHGRLKDEHGRGT